jgi:serine/threonine protein kinase
MPSVRIGQRVAGPQNEQYIISDFLGRGAFGEVYRAASESIGSVVAVKLLPVAQLTDETIRRALLNQMKAAPANRSSQCRPSPPCGRRHEHRAGTLCVYGICFGGTLARVLRGQNQSNAQIPISGAVEIDD